ncbi:MAG: carbon-phosphorus lyase complex subunit PhnI [Candidatus Thiodiazotropha lotti]|uniref:Carbon-phosphorus lyase n=1 Tax=Candidatus Thiodiazotropha endoloripes TaxID=1818881 RepID=A0A1E2UID8_9GAMM|nr:carbon-phosphorus lyase complex subunit PhnI [Candidatus Thiodiazotropha endoloripes]MCG7897248.1 carbon-phosphorus lyase complex subunit PhnI [Candidatus Thiodiazotropha weberae]MCG7993077.1 carbon-phosphorus lyase complex subunit PhnI [Candidatus Thiodiazotropha lotti]MCG7902530.1 carbon-phosphorus lyase complex subunit PhnI [Candidatus Thiodiazotropha weberae]MCG7913565.1 carbon-phosphorus lyase complex subunit PhnI [Candidatus Thiodiazotropha weberae]MCG8000211.1 carbon-phosphorus lyase
MAYVAIKGGAKAIEGSKLAYDFLRSRQGEGSQPLDTSTIENQLRLLHSRVISEGGVYHPKLASLAIKQAQGDTLEAAFALRAYRSTMPRLAETEAMDTSRMRITRRISSAFKDIPGGQMLGATTDYHLRLMRMELLDESAEAFMAISRSWFDGLDVAQIPDTFPKVLEGLRQQGLLAEAPHNPHQDLPFDITREPLIFPVPRSAALATMTRSEQGSLLALAYSNMRGYGDIHPTVAELRVGFVPVMLPHPISGKPMEIGEVEITECEVVAMYESDEQGGKPSFTLGYGACFGHNEVKAISMAILDRSLQKGMQGTPSNPSEDPEFVLLHIDGIDSMGFCTHYKMPHYVTFQSDMDRLRATQSKQAAEDQKS